MYYPELEQFLHLLVSNRPISLAKSLCLLHLEDHGPLKGAERSV